MVESKKSSERSLLFFLQSAKSNSFVYTFIKVIHVSKQILHASHIITS
jgi:hypothetical protein